MHQEITEIDIIKIIKSFSSFHPFILTLLQLDNREIKGHKNLSSDMPNSGLLRRGKIWSGKIMTKSLY